MSPSQSGKNISHTGTKSSTAHADQQLKPDYVAPLTGFRFFRPALLLRDEVFEHGLENGFKSPLTAADLQLRSPYQFQFFWDGEPHQAICNWEHSSPHPECSCGIYSYKRFKNALHDRPSDAIRTEDGKKYLKHYYDFSMVIVGEMEVWGRCEEHRDGYRSQYAQLKNLIMPSSAELVEPGGNFFRSQRRAAHLRQWKRMQQNWSSAQQVYNPYRMVQEQLKITIDRFGGPAPEAGDSGATSAAADENPLPMEVDLASPWLQVQLIQYFSAKYGIATKSVTQVI